MNFYVIIEKWNDQQMPVDVAVDLADAEAKARDLKGTVPTSEYEVKKATTVEKE